MPEKFSIRLNIDFSGKIGALIDMLDDPTDSKVLLLSITEAVKKVIDESGRLDPTKVEIEVYEFPGIAHLRHRVRIVQLSDVANQKNTDHDKKPGNHIP
jgi:hypothetical protein